MSAADEAWRDWQMRWVVDESRAGRLAGYTGNQLQQTAFMAGAKWALEDAADAVEHLPIQKTAAVLRLNAAAELRARAAAVAPRETKD